ncbi:MAG: DUF971 domain-containing protein [Gemmatimonadetes bacterium]|nr:DUF971 domain-containing protein [Gemmatimonadota bacterium]
MNKPKPRDIAVDGRASELVIGWSDGRESRYDLEGLRRACPCAHCRELRDANESGLTLLQPEAVSATAEVRGVSYVGRYGIRIEWADGHDQGIYTFEFFRALDAGG